MHFSRPEFSLKLFTPAIHSMQRNRLEQTYYRWKKKYGGMGADQLKELKRLQKENERLRKAVSDLTLDKLILAEAAKGNF
jgi:putative transposase